MNFQFSEYGTKLKEISAVNELTAAYASDFRSGIDINLGVGYVNDDTIPVKGIHTALKYIAENPGHFHSAFNYGGGEGSENLQNAIKKYYLKNKIGNLDVKHFNNIKVVIGANGATSILDALSDIFKPGIVITTDPFYYIFTDSLRRKGYKIVTIPEDKNGMQPDLLSEVIQKINIKELSFVYVVTVNNPTGSILTNDRRKKIVSIVNELSELEGRKIPVLFDKAYEDIIHKKNATKPASPLLYDKNELVFEIGTFSKILAPALRIGYLLCYNQEICELLTQRNSDIGFSASLINQEIAARLLEKNINKQKRVVNRGYRRKAQTIEALFKRKLGKYIETYTGGNAGFYYYITFKEIKTNKFSRFYQFLTRTTGEAIIDGHPEKKPRVVYIPGEICSDSEKASFQLRFSYGFENIRNIRKGIQIISEACDYALSI